MKKFTYTAVSPDMRVVHYSHSTTDSSYYDKIIRLDTSKFSGPARERHFMKKICAGDLVEYSFTDIKSIPPYPICFGTILHVSYQISNSGVTVPLGTIFLLKDGEIVSLIENEI